MAVISSCGQFQNSFHSVETILGIQKDALYKRDSLARRLKENFLENNSENTVKHQVTEVRDFAMKSGKSAGNI